MKDVAAERRSGRRNLLLLAALFFVPVLAAAWLYFSSPWRPARGTQHGELIDPPRLLPVVALTLTDGSAAPPDALRGSWMLVYLDERPCGPPCRAALTELKRVRFALDKDAVRVRRVLLHAGDCCDPPFSGAGDEDLLVLGAAGAGGQTLLALFPRAPDAGTGIYIVDPLGNLMMSYPVSGAAAGLLKDLKRLLRLSAIG
jgi:cytochrome oxidase Cu insertion factor (SCO1/SenC/PrrC family)